MRASRIGTRTFFALFLLVALLLAGGASYYASSHPDGLNSVAAKNGFGDRQKSSPTSQGPLAGYSTRGISNPRVSGGVAGLAGCALVLALSGGLFWTVRRRGHSTGDAAPAERTGA